jgi:DNA-binding protein H-NS
MVQFEVLAADPTYVISDELHESAVSNPDLDAMDLDQLWLMHEELTKILSEKITAEKRDLERRLAKLKQARNFGEARHVSALLKTKQTPRRNYPKVLPKYCNPLLPAETWSGRGKQPRWLVAALKTGLKLEELEISKIHRGR